ncbi:PREDICTED: uncharacterized protein LOC109154519 isoform X1 [Ipomoea nil]|uniref:uncharacterized protein LOC109154519 isoform X1 n=1 Tax=Ipomoea nil TaxID=35883 RepID=UPI0009013E9F|nr:PREDICTED: uncharacterized protein LOC109154519 isoform X1 [Ipomoea nil]
MASPASRQPRLLPPSKLSRPPVAPQIAHVFNFAADLRALLNITEDYVVPFLSSSLEATTERFCTSFLEISVHEYSGYHGSLPLSCLTKVEEYYDSLPLSCFLKSWSVIFKCNFKCSIDGRNSTNVGRKQNDETQVLPDED